MTPQEFDSFLDSTLRDHRLSRGERQVLADRAGNLDPAQLPGLRQLAFQKAVAALDHPDARTVLEWLEGVVKALEPKALPASVVQPEAFFSPGDHCWQRIVSFVRSAKSSLDLCVFTITDDRITRAILDTHGRGIQLRVITDNDKAYDQGSDVQELIARGVNLRIDDTPYHMHHKFAVADGKLLLNGSFNWTRSASVNNEENFTITGDVRLIAEFSREFEKLWEKFARIPGGTR